MCAVQSFLLLGAGKASPKKVVAPGPGASLNIQLQHVLQGSQPKASLRLFWGPYRFFALEYDSETFLRMPFKTSFNEPFHLSSSLPSGVFLFFFFWDSSLKILFKPRGPA